MTSANIAELKGHLSRYLGFVEQGESVEIRRRNVAIARIVPLGSKSKNRTKLGCGIGSVQVKGDLTAPAMEPNDWEMLGGLE